jgi:ArsR family transcriptional regulator, arsenate/arsenite/antimonite-responsive transcriptional repressor
MVFVHNQNKHDAAVNLALEEYVINCLIRFSDDKNCRGGDAMELENDQNHLIKMFKAISNPIRFNMLNKLASGEACTTQQLIRETGLAQSTVSQHIKVLKEAGLVNGIGKGTSTCYQVDPRKILWLQKSLNVWVKQCCAVMDSSICKDNDV